VFVFEHPGLAEPKSDRSFLQDTLADAARSLNHKPKSNLEPPSLIEFFQEAWGILEPGRPLHFNWHQELICEYLELVAEGKIKRLLINIAPRSLKSRIITVAFPCWLWLKYPWHRYMFLSYASGLANDHSDDRRKIIKSAWYQSLSGGMLLSTSKDRISEFENDSGGLMLARGLDGSVTGSGGDGLIFDDPNNPEKVESDNIREATQKKFKDYSVTRRDNPIDTFVVAVQQRTHNEDVSGFILKNLPEYTHLCLPTEAEDDEVINFPKSDRQVIRRKGDLLHPSRFGVEQNEEAKTTLGSYMYAGRHQQRPVPREGGMVKYEWFRRYRVPPAHFEQIVLSLDSSSKAKELNAPWSATIWGIWAGNYYLLSVLTKRMEYPEGKRTVGNLMLRWRPNATLIEDKSTGQSLIQEYRLNGVEDEFEKKHYFSIIPIEPEGDKVTRMSVESPAIEAGRVWLPESASWLPEYELVMTTFPLSAIADPVDSTSQFLNYIREHSIADWENAVVTGDRRVAYEVDW
jgi:predicted phage terminase large subunit-like protein